MHDEIGYQKFIKTIGTNLRTIRESKMLDLITVANATGIDPDMLDAIENGECNFEIELLPQLCNYYQVFVKDIVSEGSML
jgi:transcriptional regulator with XRE-family HTH domain